LILTITLCIGVLVNVANVSFCRRLSPETRAERFIVGAVRGARRRHVGKLAFYN